MIFGKNGWSTFLVLPAGFLVGEGVEFLPRCIAAVHLRAVLITSRWKPNHWPDRPAAVGNVAPVEPPGDYGSRHPNGLAGEGDSLPSHGHDGLLGGAGDRRWSWGAAHIAVSIPAPELGAGVACQGTMHLLQPISSERSGQSGSSSHW